MRKLNYLSIKEALKGLKNRDFTAKELAQAHLDAVKENEELNAYTEVTAELLMQRANEADIRYAKGKAEPLDGIPVAIKDLFCTRGVRTTACSKILKNFIPPYESTVSQKLIDAGTCMIGKTNMDEFAMGSANITSHFGNVLNPWRGNDNGDYVPGGSSGGSAAAVAACIAMAATGSDTGGSIRQPASFCGIVGMKPTYGRCSRYGMIAFASSLDQAGIFARSVYDTALTMQAIMGYDPKDSTTSKREVPDLTVNLAKPIKGMKIGIPKEYTSDGIDPQITALWEQGAAWLKEAGAEITEISLPMTKYALPTYYIIAPAEASSNLARYDGVRYGLRVAEIGDSIDTMYEKTRSAGFGDEVKKRILTGTYVLSAGYYDAYYKKAQRVRNMIVQGFRKAFSEVDVILAPTTPSAAFKIGEKMDDPVQMYLNDVFTVPASMAGLPAMSVPAGYSDKGLPLGLQLICNSFEDAKLLQVAHSLEQAAGFKYYHENNTKP